MSLNYKRFKITQIKFTKLKVWNQNNKKYKLHGPKMKGVIRYSECRVRRIGCGYIGPFTFDDGEVAGFEREDVHGIFESRSPHLIRIPSKSNVN